jgi:hypothetical protein
MKLFGTSKVGRCTPHSFDRDTRSIKASLFVSSSSSCVLSSSLAIFINMVNYNPFGNRNADSSNTSTPVPSVSNSQNDAARPGTAIGSEKGLTGKIPGITMRTVFMTLLVAMGGFIFGYDTGQISGFLEMPVFLQRFGEQTNDLERYPMGYYFTNVRSGLIVGLVSLPRSSIGTILIVHSCQSVL